MSTIERPPVSPGDTERAKEALVATLGADAVTDDAEALRTSCLLVWGPRLRRIARGRADAAVRRPCDVGER